MSDDSKSSAVYRFACPHCLKVLKIRNDWAGKKGICPHCKAKVEFPTVTEATSTGSPTTHQLLKMIVEQDDPAFDDDQIDRLALLFSQATCNDYHLAEKMLIGQAPGATEIRGLSPRQWRRALNSADLRESMRLHIAQRIGIPEGPANDEPAALAAATDNAAPNAWTILARFLYYQRHGICDACKINPTGLNCMYLTFDTFLAARAIPPPAPKTGSSESRRLDTVLRLCMCGLLNSLQPIFDAIEAR